MTFTQFRLSNGDEIVAQVVQEPEDDNDVNLVVRNAMMIVRMENVRAGYRYYSFRPWMSYQISDNYYQLLNYSHIIGEAKPDEILLQQYVKAVKLAQEEENNATDYDEVNSDELDALRNALQDAMSEDDPDSDTDNVISFDFGRKDTLH